MMKYKIFILLIFLGFSTFVKADQATDVLSQILKEYKKTSGLQMNVTKETYLAFLEETKTYSGMLYFSKGNLRLELEKPDKMIMVMAKDVVWIENHLDKELGGKVQVTKLKASGAVKEGNALLGFLFDNSDILKKFKVSKNEKKASKQTLMLEPKESQEFGDLTKLEVELDEKSKEIISIKHWDTVENTSHYIFSKLKKNVTIDSKKFNYQPPKGAEVTELKSANAKK